MKQILMVNKTYCYYVEDEFCFDVLNIKEDSNGMGVVSWVCTEKKQMEGRGEGFIDTVKDTNMSFEDSVKFYSKYYTIVGKTD
jgi:hypothetical protein